VRIVTRCAGLAIFRCRQRRLPARSEHAHVCIVRTCSTIKPITGQADELIHGAAEYSKTLTQGCDLQSMVRTHETNHSAVGDNGWGYVLFHGGVPSEKRPAWLPIQEIRIAVSFFPLSRGVGLNLQHALRRSSYGTCRGTSRAEHGSGASIGLANRAVCKSSTSLLKVPSSRACSMCSL